VVQAMLQNFSDDIADGAAFSLGLIWSQAVDRATDLAAGQQYEHRGQTDGIAIRHYAWKNPQYLYSRLQYSSLSTPGGAYVVVVPNCSQFAPRRVAPSATAW
jgi:hypothetical protein